jgi:hypothetical protein
MDSKETMKEGGHEVLALTLFKVLLAFAFFAFFAANPAAPSVPPCENSQLFLDREFATCIVAHSENPFARSPLRHDAPG